MFASPPKIQPRPNYCTTSLLLPPLKLSSPKFLQNLIQCHADLVTCYNRAQYKIIQIKLLKLEERDCIERKQGIALSECMDSLLIVHI